LIVQVNKNVLDDKELRAIFAEFDINGDGSIKRNELRSVMTKMGQNPTEDELDLMFKAADTDNDGCINFKGGLVTPQAFCNYGLHHSEFTAIAQANPIGLSLRQVFDEMDTDGDGVLSRSELRTAFAKLGHDLNDAQLRAIYKQVDIDDDGKISFDGWLLFFYACSINFQFFSEFVIMMTKSPQ
jgi:Ca2+-binding EF-hand superfamily protein